MQLGEAGAWRTGFFEGTTRANRAHSAIFFVIRKGLKIE